MAATTKQSKKQVIVVKNVKCNGVTHDIKFVNRGDRVVVKTKGEQTLIVRATKGLGAKKTPFESFAKGDPTFVVMAKTPAKAFAAAVHQFYN